MGLGKAWFAMLVAVVGFVFAAGSAQATTTYFRGYLSPSGNGSGCPNGTSPCVSDNGTTLEIGDGTTTTDYQIVGVSGIVSGTAVDFTFSGPAPGFFTTPMNTSANKSNSFFSVLTCGSQTFTTLSGSTTVFGIFDSSQNFLSGNCTVVDPTNLINLITETTTGCATNMVCLSFSGSGLPGSWFFAEDTSSTTCTDTGCTTSTDGPQVTGISATLGSSGGGGGGTTPTPEPASLTLLAAGVVGLGALRRKRVA